MERGNGYPMTKSGGMSVLNMVRLTLPTSVNGECWETSILGRFRAYTSWCGVVLRRKRSWRCPRQLETKFLPFFQWSTSRRWHSNTDTLPAVEAHWFSPSLSHRHHVRSYSPSRRLSVSSPEPEIPRICQSMSTPQRVS